MARLTNAQAAALADVDTYVATLLHAPKAAYALAYATAIVKGTALPAEPQSTFVPKVHVKVGRILKAHGFTLTSEAPKAPKAAPKAPAAKPATTSTPKAPKADATVTKLATSRKSARHSTKAA
jgi:hypothetical protein